MSADTHKTTQTTIGEPTAEQTTRRRATDTIPAAHGMAASKRFLLAVPAGADLDELPELWEAYQDARDGGGR